MFSGYHCTFLSVEKILQDNSVNLKIVEELTKTRLNLVRKSVGNVHPRGLLLIRCSIGGKTLRICAVRQEGGWGSIGIKYWKDFF